MAIQVHLLPCSADNAYLLAADADGPVVLVDPGADAEAIRAEVIRLRGQYDIAGIVLTHGHFDHIGAVDELRGDAPVYIHGEDAPMLTAAGGNLSTLTGMPFAVRPADAHLEEGGLTLGGTTFEVLHTPGHTRGSCCLLSDGVLISGDTLFARGYGRTDLPGGDMDALKESLRRLLKLPPETRIYPGHGDHSTIAIERRWYGYDNTAFHPATGKLC